MHVYKPDRQYYIYQNIYIGFIGIMGLLTISKMILTLIPQQALSDAILVITMVTTYHQKNYCFALLGLFYLLYQEYICVYLLLGLYQYNMSIYDENDPPKVKATKLFVLMSSIIYLLNIWSTYSIYREYKKIVFDLKRLEIQ
ncbi:hypothetical protein pb186bvf_013771 [Paramecium bursaria]